MSRRAVATLHEARQDARNIVEDRAETPGWTEEYTAWREIARALHEDGDTIGPLADGTVIEVEQVEWSVLARRGGSRHTTDTPNHVQSYAILDAYNAAH